MQQPQQRGTDKSSFGDMSLVRYKKDGLKFEVATQHGAVARFREAGCPKDDNLSGVLLIADAVFTNFSKGERAADADLQRVFGTADAAQVARVVVEKGEVQVTTEERREMTERRRREMVEYVRKTYVDPKTHLPIPAARIEAAFEQLRIHADPDVDAVRQVREKVVKRLPEVLPIKRNEVDVVLRLPHEFVGRCSGLVYSIAHVRSEKFSDDGVAYEASLPYSDQERLLAELRKITDGNFEYILEGADASPSPSADASSSAKGKGKKGGGGGKHRAK